MLADRNKFSIRQAMLLFITMSFSPVVRLVPGYSAQAAKQVGWLTPIPALIVFGLFIWILQKTFQKHNNASYSDIIYKVLGKPVGKLVILIYFLWITCIVSLYIRYYGERLVRSIYPNINMSIFIVVMLLMISYFLRDDFSIIARMNEVLLPFIVIIFGILTLLLFPDVEVTNLTPFCYKDIIPIMKGSLGVMAVWCYIFVILFLGDKINNKEQIQSSGWRTLGLSFISALMLNLTDIGSLGYSVVQRLPLPFFVATKQISLFNTLEKIESFAVAVWIASDFIIITVLVYVAMHLFQSLFNLKDSKPFINIFLVLSYIFTLYISNGKFELEAFSAQLFTPINCILFIALPMLIFLIGKIRKKV